MAAAHDPMHAATEGLKGFFHWAKDKLEELTHFGVSRVPHTSLPLLIKPRGGQFFLPPLPFDASNGCAPLFSKHQLLLHYDQHHKHYVDHLNMFVGADTRFDGLSIEDIIRNVPYGPLFDNAAQHFNHSFFWQCLIPNAGGDATIPPDLANCLMICFGSIANFKNVFQQAASEVHNFGSGWTWLVYDAAAVNDRAVLKIVNTHDAETPITSTSYIPLLCIDVWEHAYYVDYEDRRYDYLLQFWNIVNWQFVGSEFIRSRGLRPAQ